MLPHLPAVVRVFLGTRPTDLRYGVGWRPSVSHHAEFGAATLATGPLCQALP
jgi:hypothetical protein